MCYFAANSNISLILILVPIIQFQHLLQMLTLLTFVALVTFLPSLQFMPKSIVWFNDRQRLLELLLLCFVLLNGILIGFTKATNQVHISTSLRKLFLILLGLAIISCSLAYSPRQALVETSTFMGLGYLALFVARLFNENKDLLLKKLSYVLWASILLYMLSFYTGYITATIFKTPLQWPFPFTGFTNVRSFNQYQLWSLGLLCLPFFNQNLKKSTRICLHIAFTGWWVLLFYSASRGVLLAWLVGMLAIAIIYQKKAWPFLRLQLTQIVTGFISYIVLFKMIPALFQHHLVTGTVIRETANDRIGLWVNAIALVNEFPFFGAGPMHFAWYSQSNAHPHNSILQLAAEFGVPFTILILAMTVFGIMCWFKKFNANSLSNQPMLDVQLTVILIFTLTINAAYSMVDGVIVTPISQVLMFTMIGLATAHFNYDDIVQARNVTLEKAKFRPMIAGFVLIIMTWSTLPELVRGLSGNEKGFSMGYTAAGPRFWRETK